MVILFKGGIMFAKFCSSLTTFSLKGRTNRCEFTNFFLIWFLISLFFFITCFVLYIFSFGITVDFTSWHISSGGEISQIYLSAFVGLSAIFLIFEVWAFIAGSIITVKRLHDINLSGLYYWLLLFTFILLCINDCKILAGFLAYIAIGCILFLFFAESYPFLNKYDNIEEKSTRGESCNGEIPLQ